MVTFLGRVTFLGMVMATIIGMITNDHSRDGGHPWGCLEDLVHFGEGYLPRDGDHPKMVTIIGMVTILDMVGFLPW